MQPSENGSMVLRVTDSNDGTPQIPGTERPPMTDAEMVKATRSKWRRAVRRVSSMDNPDVGGEGSSPERTQRGGVEAAGGSNDDVLAAGTGKTPRGGRKWRAAAGAVGVATRKPHTTALRGFLQPVLANTGASCHVARDGPEEERVTDDLFSQAARSAHSRVF